MILAGNLQVSDHTKALHRWLLITAAAFGFGILLMIFLSSTTYAAGGVGSGGDPSGGGAGGHYTWNGWGWAKYSSGGSGPTDGFNTGNWGSIQSACQSAGASSVYVFIIDSAAGNGKSYNYQTKYDPFAAHFPTGSSVDYGRATAISTSTANSAFDSLGSYGVSTSGYAFGVNVAWFCYDFETNHAPTGSVSVACTTAVDGTHTYTFKYSFSDADGSSSAKTAGFLSSSAYPADDDSHALPGSYVSAGSPYKSASKTLNYTGSWPAPHRGIYLRVADIHPDHSHTWITIRPGAGEPSCPAPPNSLPSGSVTIVCDPSGDGSATIKYNYSDSDGSGGKTTAYSKVAVGTPGTQYSGTTLRDSGWTYHGLSTSDMGTLSPSQTTGNYNVWLFVQDVGPNGDNLYHGRISSVTSAENVKCKHLPACGSITIAPDSIDPFTQFSVTVSASNNLGSTSGNKMTLQIGPKPPASWSYGPVTTSSLSTAGDNSSATFSNIGPTNEGGIYYVQWTYANAEGSVTCGSLIKEANDNEITIGYKPYFHVNGGDIQVGNGFSSAGGNTCGQTADASIVGWNQNSGSFTGAGTQYAAYALGLISYYATAQQQSGEHPSGLAFANTSGVDTSSGTYGGNFGGYSACIPDYYGSMPASAQAYNGSNVTSLSSGSYKISGDYTLGSTNISSHDRIVLYVNGDVQLNGDITFTGNFDASKPPYFEIVATGNIYIAPNVNTIDAVLVAQGGTLYTCSNSFTPITLDGNLYSTCDQPLTINGAVVATNIELLRAAGSVGKANAPAETINFNPLDWIAGSQLQNTNPSYKYDAITSLPPVL